MSRFTPGPWKAEQACDMGGFKQSEWWISAKGDIDIATTSGEKKPEEEAANAYLIAAAPDMYEAAQKVLKSAELLLKVKGIVIADMYELAAALKKARGEGN